MKGCKSSYRNIASMFQHNVSTQQQRWRNKPHRISSRGLSRTIDIVKLLDYLKSTVYDVYKRWDEDNVDVLNDRYLASNRSDVPPTTPSTR